jgi:DeoR family transcriptional regulator, aga operon transcriptional repressor
MARKPVTLSNLERQNRIYELIRSQERIEIEEICELFTVSPSTARRDLDELVNRNLVERFHGGAVMRTFTIDADLPISSRSKAQANPKKRIGQAAARLINDGDSVFLASGTTVLEVAKNLRTTNNLEIITNSLPVLNIFSEISSMNVVCVGGVLRRSELSFTGHIAEKTLEEIRVDKVILGIYALSLVDGITHSFVQETMTDRSIIKSGRQLIVVADHTKLEHHSTAIIAPLSQVHTLVTDTEADAEFIQELTRRGVQVIQA